jgi:hypothetical protein
MWKREKEENRGQRAILQAPGYSTPIDEKEHACIIGPIVAML